MHHIKTIIKQNALALSDKVIFLKKKKNNVHSMGARKKRGGGGESRSLSPKFSNSIN